MNRKILVLILTGIISFLLVTGCSSPKESGESPNTDATQEETAAEEENTTILPADAKIGIAYTAKEGEFTSFFITKTMGNLVSAGIPEEGIERLGGSEEELADNAMKLIDGGCSVLMIGNADEENAPAITDAAVKAGIPVLYFGTSPGDAEIARWEEKGLRAAYVGSTYEQAAQKRADLIDSTDLESLDLNEDGEIGAVVLYYGKGKPGDTVNRATLKIIEEQEIPVHVLTDEEESSEDEEEASGEPAEEEEPSEEEPVQEETAEEEPAEEENPAEGGESPEEEETSGDSEEEQYGESVRESAKEQVIEWMTQYGKQLELIICADDMQALGAWDAVSEEKKLVGHDVLIMGFDSNTESLAEVAAGNIRSSFFNDFMEQSKNASDLVLAFLKGADAQPRTMSEYVSVTVDNAQEILDISMKAQENDPDADTEEDTEEE